MFLENKLKGSERNIPLVKKTSSFTSETVDKVNSNLNTASKQAEIGRIVVNSTEVEERDIPVKEKDQSVASVVQVINLLFLSCRNRGNTGRILWMKPSNLLINMSIGKTMKQTNIWNEN